MANTLLIKTVPHQSLIIGTGEVEAKGLIGKPAIQRAPGGTQAQYVHNPSLFVTVHVQYSNTQASFHISFHGEEGKKKGAMMIIPRIPRWNFFSSSFGFNCFALSFERETEHRQTDRQYNLCVFWLGGAHALVWAQVRALAKRHAEER